MTRIAPLLPLALGACVAGTGAPPPLEPLAADPAQPRVALFEHVLTGYFSRLGALGPTVCADGAGEPLSAEQEQALIARFVRLAPADRCRAAADRWRDAITGDPADVVSVYDFACTREMQLCSGWVRVPGLPATRYTLRYAEGEWRFDADPRAIAE